MLKLHENELDIDTYLNLRAAVGWKKLDNEQAIMALKNSIYTLTATIDDKVVGMARMVGDGAVICYIQDLVVHPSYQKLGVGQVLMEKLVGHAEEIKIQGTELMLCLMCAKGREGFYEKFGFIARPTENLGPGMIMYL
ncbi:MAG: GNAT family N-acetyltransferase [Lachnospiraceae bacterium]|jgi:GNAT superfamily N-acetyltransferase|nr:GNAT family N-acetyltransferase [Lachnospiraceae bacterium]